MHVSTHVLSVRAGIILYINTCGKQGRALETAAGNPWSGCLMLAYALGIHYHLFLQREGLYQQAAAPLGASYIHPVCIYTQEVLRAEPNVIAALLTYTMGTLWGAGECLLLIRLVS